MRKEKLYKLRIKTMAMGISFTLAMGAITPIFAYEQMPLQTRTTQLEGINEEVFLQNKEEPNTEIENSNEEEPNTEIENSNEEESNTEIENSNEEESNTEIENSNEEESNTEIENSNEEESNTEIENSNEEEPNTEIENSNEEESNTEIENSNEEESNTQIENSNEEELNTELGDLIELKGYVESEPNNNTSQADIIKLNTLYNATTESYDYDYFKFTIPSNGFVDINVWRNENVKFDIELLDINFNVHNEMLTAYGGGNASVRTGLPKGTYYIRVEKYRDSNPDTQYKFSVNFTSKGNYETEFNNTSSTADNISLNTSYYGMTESYDYDYFKFIIPSNGYVDINIGKNENVKFNVDLLDINLNEHNGIVTSYGSGVATQRTGLPKGTYYVRVQKYNDSNVDTQYNFSINFTHKDNYETEFNDSKSTADKISLNKTYYGMTESYEYDYYKFILPSNGYVDINVARSEDVKFDVDLLDVNLNVHKGLNTMYGNGVESTRQGLAKGTYYVRISKYSNYDLNTQYRFSINFTARENWETEFNDSKTTADKIQLGTKYYGITESYEYDYFKFELYEDDIVNLKFGKNNNVRFDVELLDVNLNNIDGVNTDYGSGEVVLKNQLSKGTYYVRVSKYSSSNSNTQYSFLMLAQNSSNNIQFCDIDGTWAEKQILNFAKEGYIDRTQSRFRPNDYITRAEFIKIVNKVFNFTSIGTESFSDVNPGPWYYNEVCKAVKAGYIDSKQTKFRPNDPISREEAASIITKIKKCKDNNLDQIKKYTDYKQVSSWALSSVEGAIEKGYMGKGSSEFRPKANITRAEAVVTLYRVIN